MVKPHRLATYLLAEIVPFGRGSALQWMFWQRQQEVIVNVIRSHAVFGAEIEQCLGGSEPRRPAPRTEFWATLLPLDGVLKTGFCLNQTSADERFRHSRERAMANRIACEA